MFVVVLVYFQYGGLRKLGNAWESAPIFAELQLLMGAEAACCEETSFAVHALLRQRVRTNWARRKGLTAPPSATDGCVV